MSTASLQELLKSKPLVMGILNVTPDSFADGGRYIQPGQALQQAMSMLDAGADIIDIGGESTRPGAAEVSVDEECARVLPVIEAIKTAAPDCLVSIDTSKAEVMRQAVSAGAGMINDVNALRSPGALEAAAELNVPVCLMHMAGTPRTMQDNPQYNDVVEDIARFLTERVDACKNAGIVAENIVLDPGFGFGKTLEHNVELLARLNRFNDAGFPVLVGISRKSMFAMLLGGIPVEERLPASLAAAILAVQKGAAIVRVHDVRATKDALEVLAAVNRVPVKS